VPITLVEKIAPLGRTAASRYAVGLTAFTIAFIVRYSLSDTLNDMPFATFLPAILIAALLAGWRVGLGVACLSCAAAWYFFLPPHGTFALKMPNGLTRIVLFWITAGTQLFIVGAIIDALAKLAAERDRVSLLFQELQHRVANNMAFVAGLLRMQRRAAEASPQNAVMLFDQAESRISVMARIHRRLYDPAVLDLPLAAYLEALAKDVLEAAGATNIVCVVETDSSRLDMTKLLPMSLLITELMTNALKHGFAGRHEGTITLRLVRNGSNFVLSVSDNGRGLEPAGIGDGSLGMRIVRSLAAQLGGSVEWLSDQGTTARLAFPV
jgi:two-component sensor histidine kinase